MKYPKLFSTINCKALAIILALPSLLTAQTATENYVRSCNYKTATLTEISNPTAAQAMVQVSYVDGLGRPTQNIAVKQSPLGGDVVQFTQYDIYGREVKSYLPYVKNANNGEFVTNPITEQASFYTTASSVAHTAYPFSENVFDNSPLNRVLEQSAPGEVWRLGQGHTKSSAMLVNETDEIKWYAVHPTTGDLIQISNSGGYYPAEQLMGAITTDENGNTARTFTDGLGNTVMVESGTTGANIYTKRIQTYYVYDDMNRLRYVLQPEWQEQLTSGLSTTEMINRYAFVYNYDARGFINYKKLPGAEPIYYVYDPLGKPILSQDGNQRALNKWFFTKYDALGRPILTGLWTQTATATAGATHPNPVSERISSTYFTPTYFNNFTNFYETRSTAAPFYTNATFPNTADCEVLTKSYYDYYDIQNTNTATPITTASNDFITNRESQGYGNAVTFGTNKFSPRVRGQLIKTEVKELGSANTYQSTSFVYDKNYRIIQSNDSWEGVQNFKYDFEGKLNSSLEKVLGKKIGKIYAYDAGNRPKNNVIHYGTAVFDFKQYVYNWYNELGQLVEKGLGNNTINSTGLGFLQSVDYRYNERGWLTSINNAQLTNDYQMVSSANTAINTWPYGTNAQYATSKLTQLATIQAQVDAGTLNPVGALNGILAEFISQVTNSPLNYVAKYVVSTFDDISDPNYDYATTWTQLHDAIVSWQMGSFLNDDNTDLFGMELQYTDGNPQLNAQAQYNGNISMMKWRNKSTSNNGNATAEKAYGFDYDGIGRLKNAYYAELGSNTNNQPAWTANVGRYDEKEINYDRNGNITKLVRNGMIAGTAQAPTFGTMDDLVYTYIGNQLKQVVDAQTATAQPLQFVPASNPLTDYLYDANGNMTTDPHKGITIQYNYLNLPQTITFTNGNTIVITYDATGRKMKKTVTQAGNSTTKEYRGGFEFAGANLESYYHEEGRLVPKTGGGYQLEYTLKDHLGNARITFADINVNGSINAATEILQEETYYPFGLQQSGFNTSINGVENKYQYNGKEFNDDLGLNMCDYGARFYDAALGRWNVLDKEIEKYPTLSAYSYCLNNPLIFIDPTGNVVEEADNEETKTYLAMLIKDKKAEATLESLKKSDIVYHINVSANLDEETYGAQASETTLGGSTNYDFKKDRVNILVKYDKNNPALNLAALADEVKTGELFENGDIGFVQEQDGNIGAFAYNAKDEVETKKASVDALKANDMTVNETDPEGKYNSTKIMSLIENGETDMNELMDALMKSGYGEYLGIKKGNVYNDDKAKDKVPKFAKNKIYMEDKKIKR